MSGNYKFLQKDTPTKYQGGLEESSRETETKLDINIDDLVSSIHLQTGMRKTEIKTIVLALENSIQEALSENRIVRLEKLGNFYPSVITRVHNSCESELPKKVEKRTMARNKIENCINSLAQYSGLMIKGVKSIID